MEILDKYELEIEKIVKTIRTNKAKLIVLQFPDALKPYATQIAKEIESKTQGKCLIWLNSCFGACDIPLEIKNLNPAPDMLIQFGHSKWEKTNNLNIS